MTKISYSLDDLMREEDERRLAETRAEMAAERAAWDALTDEERAAHIASIEAKYADIPDTDESDEDEEDEE